MAVSVDGVRLTRRYQCAAQTLWKRFLDSLAPYLHTIRVCFFLFCFFINAERLIFCLKEYLALFFQGVGQDGM